MSLEEFHCTMALKFCVEARRLMSEKRYSEVAELCSRISQLCRATGRSACVEESQICSRVAELLKSGEVDEAIRLCKLAVVKCPSGVRATLSA